MKAEQIPTDEETPALRRGHPSSGRQHQRPSPQRARYNTDPVFGVACQYCGAGVGEQCHNGITGMPLRRALCHPVRLAAAHPHLVSGDGGDES